MEGTLKDSSFRSLLVSVRTIKNHDGSKFGQNVNVSNALCHGKGIITYHENGSIIDLLWARMKVYTNLIIWWLSAAYAFANKATSQGIFCGANEIPKNRSPMRLTPEEFVCVVTEALGAAISSFSKYLKSYQKLDNYENLLGGRLIGLGSRIKNYAEIYCVGFKSYWGMDKMSLGVTLLVCFRHLLMDVYSSCVTSWKSYEMWYYS